MMGGPGGIPPLASLRGFKSRTLTLFFLVFLVAMFFPLSCCEFPTLRRREDDFSGLIDPWGRMAGAVTKRF